MQEDALRRAADAIRAGKIVALKGLGGFQLIVDARKQAAVVRLRERKHREEKPFALMYPSLDAVRVDCEILPLEERLLLSPESPIVLVGRARRAGRTEGPAVRPYQLAKSIAPRNPNLGVMLPYSPLHHLLMRELSFPIVATSGNLSDEPICIDEHEALQRLHGIADLFLVHDRPIVRHVDDSMVRVICDREMMLRRTRGYAPLPIPIRSKIENRKSRNVLAVGAHLKNTVALKIDNNIFISQHIGDLETKQAYSAFRHSAQDLPRLYDARIDIVACDMHPDYLSTKHSDEIAGWAGSPLPAGNGETCPYQNRVQHHWRTSPHAWQKIRSNRRPWRGMGRNRLRFGRNDLGRRILARQKQMELFERVAHFRQFRLPGGDRAIKEPRRSALGLLYEMFGERRLGLFTADCRSFRKRRNRCFGKCWKNKSTRRSHPVPADYSMPWRR